MVASQALLNILTGFNIKVNNTDLITGVDTSVLPSNYSAEGTIKNSMREKQRLETI